MALVSRQTAMRQVRSLLRAASAGDRDSAAVLVDALAYAGRQDLADPLALAVAGKQGTVREVVGNIQYALRRRAPCMPGRRAFLRLMEEVHGAPLDRNLNRVAARVWAAMRKACGTTYGYGGQRWNEILVALDAANDGLRGHGIEAIPGGTRYEGMSYVNMGDSYITTLAYDWAKDRFVIADYETLVLDIERRAERQR